MLLALIFLVVISLVVISIERWTGNNLSNTSRFVSAQSVQSEANSANDLAIQYVRYTFQDAGLDGATPTSCWTTGSASQYPPTGEAFPGPTVSPVDAWCMTRWYPENSQRVVTVSTCKSTVSAATCEASPLLQTIVVIGDNEAGCPALPVGSTASDTTCGHTMSISDWQFGAAPPVVTSATTGSFTCAAGTPVTVAGSGLALATNVDFLVPSTAGSGGPVWAPGTMATGASSFNSPATSDTTIQACSPAALSSYSSLYVLVSTPQGTNSYGATSEWGGG